MDKGGVEWRGEKGELRNVIVEIMTESCILTILLLMED